MPESNKNNYSKKYRFKNWLTRNTGSIPTSIDVCVQECGPDSIDLHIKLQTPLETSLMRQTTWTTNSFPGFATGSPNPNYPPDKREMYYWDCQKGSWKPTDTRGPHRGN